MFARPIPISAKPRNASRTGNVSVDVGRSAGLIAIATIQVNQAYAKRIARLKKVLQAVQMPLTVHARALK